MTALWPCPKCGDPDGPVMAARAQGRNTFLVACRKCLHKGRETATRDSAAEQWNAVAERSARQRERRAVRALVLAAGALRRDARFVAEILERYVGRLQLEDGGPHYQSFRLNVAGTDMAVNTRVLVDDRLMIEWPELTHVKDPERIVHFVLEDAGKSARGSYVKTGEDAGKRLGKWCRTLPAVGILPEGTSTRGAA